MESDRNPDVQVDGGGSESNVENSERPYSRYRKIICKIPYPEYIRSFINKTQLIRETEKITCDNFLRDNVVNNYLIVKRILRHLTWQEKVMCKNVCKTWYAAVLALGKECLSPIDFTVLVNRPREVCVQYSGDFETEPLVVFLFCNEYLFTVSHPCTTYRPSPCKPACRNDHYVVDYAKHIICIPEECMMTVQAGNISYCPLQDSVTQRFRITQNMIRSRYRVPFLGGVYIPKIPNVQFHLIKMKVNSDIDKEFYQVVANIAKDQIFKGVLVYITDKFILHSTVDKSLFLNYFKELQPDIPYALGGCIVDDALGECDVTDLMTNHEPDSALEGCSISDNLATIGIFTVAKNSTPAESHNFDMFSLILQSSHWSKSNILKVIEEFSQAVPQFEHTVGVKLSCVGRDQKNECEEEYFRTYFPETRLIGCFGNGEIGINHPKHALEDPPYPKRPRQPPRSPIDVEYSYSTIFVYMGWGKIIPSRNNPTLEE